MKQLSLTKARTKLSTLIVEVDQERDPVKLRGSMKIVGDLDQALDELGKERDKSLRRLVSELK